MTIRIARRAVVLATILAGLHEPVAARTVLAEAPPLTFSGNPPYSVPSLTIALEEQDWPAVLAAEMDFASLAAQFPGLAEDRAHRRASSRLHER